jgi:nucleoside-diphosphate-sugar epimerase
METAPSKHFGPTSVIAGGAGFLGSHLAEILLAQGQRVVVLDNYSTGKEENLRTLFNNPNFSFKIGDINQGLPELGRVDYIFHLAGVEEYLNGTDVSLQTLLVNSVGTRNLLELAKAHQAKITLVSTQDIYSGLLATGSLEHLGAGSRDEERQAHHEAKRFSETLASEYFRKFNVDARIVRLADVYGPRMDLRSGSELAELLAQSLQTEPRLTIHGDGSTVLHPSFISDVVYGLVKAAMSQESRGQVINLVTPTPVTVLELAQTLRQLAPIRPEITLTQEIAETKFKESAALPAPTLNWRPTVGLEEGLKRTLAYFRDQKEVPAVPTLPVVSTNLIQNSVQTSPVTSVEKEDSIQPFSGGSWLNRVKKIGLGKPSRGLASKLALAVSLIFIGLAAVAPSFAVVYHSGYGAWQMRESLKAVTSAQQDSAIFEAGRAEASFTAGVDQINNLTWLASLLQLRQPAENYRVLVLSAEEATISVRYLARALGPLLSEGEDNEAEVASNLDLADEHLSLAEAHLAAVDSEDLPPLARDLRGFTEDSLDWLERAISQARLAVGEPGELVINP